MTELATADWTARARDLPLDRRMVPAARSQCALRILTCLIARLINVPAPIARPSGAALRSLPPLAFSVAPAREGVTRSFFGSGKVIALAKRVFPCLAARQLAQKVLTNGFLRMLGRIAQITAAALCALEPALKWMGQTTVSPDSIRFALRPLPSGAMVFRVDGPSIEVPSDPFILARQTNCSYETSPNRYRGRLILSCAAELKRMPAIIGGAVSALACDLTAFGEKMLESCVKGVDCKVNRRMSPVMFAIWNACRDNGIAMPHPLSMGVQGA